MATAAIILFNVQLSAHAKSLKVFDGKTVTIHGNTYDALHAKNGSKIIGKHLTVTHSNDAYAIIAEGSNTAIELLDGTTIKGTASDILFGLEVKEGATLKMIGGIVTVSRIGANFSNSKSDKNELRNVKISSSKNKKTLITGIATDKESNVTLENVTVTQAKHGIVAYNQSQIMISGGSFEGKDVGIYAENGSKITLINSKESAPQITSSSNGKGIYTNGLHSTITMTGGKVSGEEALLAENGGYIKVTDVSLTTNGHGVGAAAVISDSMIELYGNTTIKNTEVGLVAINGGRIKMVGGTIMASATGIGFVNSKSDENKLENVTISTGKEKNSGKGIFLEKESRITLKNVKVTQTGNSIIANNHSKITVSGGSLDSSYATICAQNGSSIILTDNAQITSHDEGGLYAEGAGSKITMTTGSVTGKSTALEADRGGHITVTNVTLKATNDGSGVAAGAAASGSNSVIELLGNTTISNVKIGIDAQNDSTIKMIGGTIKSSEAGVHLLKNKSNNKLKDVTILNSKDNALLINGIIARRSKITLENVTVKQTNNSIVSNNDSQITVSGGSFSAKGAAIYALKGSTITLTDNAQITSSDNSGLYAKDSKSTITMIGGTVIAKKDAFVVSNNGHIDVRDVSATAENRGIAFEKSNNNKTAEVNLTNTKLRIKNGTGMNANESTGKVNLRNSEIHADVLLITKASAKKNNSAFTLNADHSVLKGRVDFEKNFKTVFDLQNNTKWTLKTSTQEKDADGKLLDIAQRARSDVSVLNLNNSSIVFAEPIEGHYHTLHIGSGKPETKAVYNATGNAQISFNTLWNDSKPITEQKTDRLLIHGDVSGTTLVYVTGHLKKNNIEENNSTPSNMHDFSLIQVFGKANLNSFKLANGYITISGSPYKYILKAYETMSNHSKNNGKQNLSGENKKFWDFRLQPVLLDNNSKVKTVVP